LKSTPPRSAEAVEAAFYAALAQGEIRAVMALWADDDAIVCNHPSGPRLIGRAAIEESFRQILAHGGLHIRPSRVHAVRTADMAVHSLIECITVSGPGGPQDIEVIATNVFVRSPLGWRLLMHHAGVAEDEDDDDLDQDADLEFEGADPDTQGAVERWGVGPQGPAVSPVRGTEPADDNDDDPHALPRDRRRLH
jgi:ketosteroid isomerase-like protein